MPCGVEEIVEEVISKDAFAGLREVWPRRRRQDLCELGWCSVAGGAAELFQES